MGTDEIVNQKMGPSETDVAMAQLRDNHNQQNNARKEYFGEEDIMNNGFQENNRPSSHMQGKRQVREEYNVVAANSDEAKAAIKGNSPATK